MTQFKSTMCILPVTALVAMLLCGAADATTADGSNTIEPVEEVFRLATGGDIAAQRRLGNMFLTGTGVIQSHTEAMKWYRLAADKGDAEAQNMIGLMYVHELGVPRDYAMAVDWLRLSAGQGFADAQYNLGSMYYLGEGVERDYSAAAKWLRSAALQKHVNAGNDLAWLLSTCPDDSIRNGEEAVRLIERVIESRPGDMRFLSTLAAAYAETGRFEEAVETQGRALAAITETDVLYADFQDQLQQYRGNQPWREE